MTKTITLQLPFKNINIPIKNIIVIAFVIFISVVLYLTIFSRNPMDKAVFKFSPFWHYKCIGYLPNLKDILQNIALLFPFGGFLRIFKMKFWKTVVMAFAFSTAIECAQFFFKLGHADVDDVIHNVIGAGCGFASASMAVRYFKRLK